MANYCLSVLQLAFIRQGKVQRTGFIGLEFHGNDIVGHRCYHCTAVVYIPDPIADSHRGIVQQQFTTVVTGVLVVPELQKDVTHRQETHAVRTLDKILVQQFMGFFLATVEDQLAHFL